MPTDIEAKSPGIAARTWTYLRTSFSDWSEDNASRLAAALAFWTMLSIAPLLIVSIKLTGVIFEEEAAKGQVGTYLEQTVGMKNAETLQGMVQSAGAEGAGVFATIFSIALLIWSASNVFVELQSSLNTLWEVKPDPNKGWLQTIKDRAFSMALVLSIAFLLLVSLVLTTVLSGITKGLSGGQIGWLMELIHTVLAIGVITALFAMMFKYLPDVKIAWRDVWIGALVTAVLFTIGKFALGWYLGRGSATSVYGAAGSIVALLLWVYYSALILFFGAEFTQVYAKAHNRNLETERGAQPLTDDARAQQGLAPKRGAKPGVKYGQPKPAWQRYDASGAPSRIVTIERPAPGTRKAFTIAGVGLATGAALAAAGWFTKKQNSTQSSAFQQRLDAVQSRLGRIENLQHAQRQVTLADRIQAVQQRINTMKAEGGSVRTERGSSEPAAAANGTSTARVAASDVLHRFAASFQRARAETAQPRTLAERFKAWIAS